MPHVSKAAASAALLALTLVAACSRPRQPGDGAATDAADTGRPPDAGAPAAVPSPSSGAARLGEAEVGEILATDSAFAAGIAAGDADAVAAAYAEDAVLMPPDARPIKGRAAIRGYWAGLLQRYTAEFEIGSDELDGRGDLAYNRGHFHLELTPKAAGTPRLPAQDGKFLEVLRRQADGSWQYTVDMYSGNGAPRRP